MTLKRFKGIESVEAAGPWQLRVRFTGECQAQLVDLRARYGTSATFAPLADPVLFAGVHVIDQGGGIAWSDELDADGEVIWRMALEARGEIMPSADFRAWRERHRLSLSDAAAALGISRRMVAGYASGELPVPRTVMLATRGWEALAAAGAFGARVG